MEIEIYEPQQLLIPSITEGRKQLKCTIKIIDVKQIDNKYFILLNDLEAKIALEFINANRDSGMSEFNIHILSINKWIKSKTIETDKGLLIFTAFKEDFMLSN